MRRIVVLGAGFGGLHALTPLERALGSRRRTHLTVINSSPSFLFTPLLPNVASAEIGLKAITLDLRAHLDPETDLLVDRATHVDPNTRQVHTERSGAIPFDYLLLAPGSVTDWRGHEAWRPHAMTCKSSHDATLIRDAVTRAVREAAQLPDPQRLAHLTFVFAGAGPTGVELAAELWAHLRQELLPRAPDDLGSHLRFVLIDPNAQILSDLPSTLQTIAHTHLESIGIDVILGRRVVHRDARSVVLDDDTEIEAAHFFWCAGVRPSPLITDSSFSLGEAQRLLTTPYLSVQDHEGIFAIGDATLSPSGMRQTADAATQQGPVAAHNLLASMAGRTPHAFVPRPKGEMITLGRPNAVVSLLGATLEGIPAYALYRLAYAAMMPSPLKKARIIAEWLEHDLSMLTESPPLIEETQEE